MKTRNLSILIALSCIGASAAANYDLLGRKGSQMSSPMVYKNVNYKNKNTQATSILEKQGLTEKAKAIEGINDPAFLDQGTLYSCCYTYIDGSYVYGYADRYTVYTTSNSTKRFWIGDLVNDFTYDRRIADYYTPIYRYRTAWTTSSALTNTSYNGSISFDMYPPNPEDTSDFVHGAKIHLSPIDTLRDIKISHNATVSFEETNPEQIGIYIAGKADPARLAKNTPLKYVSKYGCKTQAMPGYENEMTLMVASLLELSPNVIPFVLNTQCGDKTLPDPENQSPQVLVGLHTDKDYHRNSSATSSYSAVAKALDNYIYEHHTVEIVGAGNFGIKNNGTTWAGNLASEAHAANAITVGSVDFNKRIEATSSWKNPVYGGKKPEIYNYTNYYFPGEKAKKYGTKYKYMPFVEGTRGAATNTAAAVVDLLRKEPFLRWHPEVVKARLLTAADVSTVGTSDRDNGDGSILSYGKLFSLSTSTSGKDYRNYSRFWNGDISKLMDSNKEIKFTIKIEGGGTYRAAIAWLSYGDDISALGKIPQDFDLSVYKSKSATLKSYQTVNGSDSTFPYYYDSNFSKTKNSFIRESTSSSNPFEIVEFSANTNDYITFVIKLNKDASVSAKSVGKMYLGFNLLETAK